MMKNSVLRSILFIFFLLHTAMVPCTSYAQGSLELSAVGLTASVMPPLLKGIIPDKTDPFKFTFIFDGGDATDISPETMRPIADELVKYFFAAVTINEKDQWVNLSPYESNRIIPQAFGQTQMGLNMLTQDYLLKQLTATLLDPDTESGKTFWEKIRVEANTRFGTADIPIETANKIWIIPKSARIFERNGTAVITESSLAVMVEEDYASLLATSPNAFEQTSIVGRDVPPTAPQQLAVEVMREVIVPLIEKEVNTGATFAPLRQMYHSMILAAWYKQAMRTAIFNQLYADQNTTGGIESADRADVDATYQRYLEIFRRGAAGVIREEYDPISQDVIPRKYVSGGIRGEVAETITTAMAPDTDQAMLVEGIGKNPYLLTVRATARVEEPTRGPGKGDTVSISPEGMIRSRLGMLYRAGQIDPLMADDALWDSVKNDDVLKRYADDDIGLAGASQLIRDHVAWFKVEFAKDIPEAFRPVAPIEKTDGAVSYDPKKEGYANSSDANTETDERDASMLGSREFHWIASEVIRIENALGDTSYYSQNEKMKEASQRIRRVGEFFSGVVVPIIDAQGAIVKTNGEPAETDLSIARLMQYHFIRPQATAGALTEYDHREITRDITDIEEMRGGTDWKERPTPLIEKTIAAMEAGALTFANEYVDVIDDARNRLGNIDKNIAKFLGYKTRDHAMLTADQRKQVTILFVDDTAINRELFGKYLLHEEGKYTVVTAADPQEAIALIKDPQNRFDFIVSDQSMPGMNGTEFAAYLLKNKIPIPFVIATANDITAKDIEEFQKKASNILMVYDKSKLANIQDALFAFIDETVMSKRVSEDPPVGDPTKEVGGINFDAALLNLNVKQDETGVPLPLSPQELDALRIDGITPIIINIVPLADPTVLFSVPAVLPAAIDG